MSGNDDHSDLTGAFEDLIGQLKKLSVACSEPSPQSVSIKKKVSALKFAQELEQIGIYSFCFEGTVSLEGFRGWAATNWLREKKIKFTSTRPVGPSPFITVCETKDDRDKGLQSKVAILRSSLLVHYPWKPQCDDPQYLPAEKPTTVEILSYPTWARDLLPEVFELIAPVLRISAAAKLLAVENPRAILLWHPSRAPPATVGLEVEADKPGGQSCKLLLPETVGSTKERLLCWEYGGKKGVQTSPVNGTELHNCGGVQKAEVSARVLVADAEGKKGGVAILVHSSCTVKEWRALNNRLIWATIQVSSITVSLVSFYCPVDAPERKLFWRQLIQSLPSKRFLFVGDRNVVESPEDSSSKSKWLSRQETEFLHAWMEMRCVVKDAQYKESQQLSTLDEKKQLLMALGNAGKLDPAQLEEY
ncbi:hypothetical protein R1sor_025098 [Riccia sorocarpa]|uniref:Uncharacterized protein n=1 Tax=Riccia sorocarpa TaxID=122646 RepID=A0ABD3G7L7_9MARC